MKAHLTIAFLVVGSCASSELPGRDAARSRDEPAVPVVDVLRPPGAPTTPSAAPSDAHLHHHHGAP